jgi:hypothetical protein
MKKFALIGLLVAIPLAVAIVFVWRQFREAKYYCIYSYVSSVQKSINDFQTRHGRYPSNLSEIDASGTDHDCGIRLDELHYEIRDDSAVIWYQWGDRRVSPAQDLTKSPSGAE